MSFYFFKKLIYSPPPPVVALALLIPSILTCALIYFGSNIFLKNPILIFIGNISYSLYLWHWIFLSSFRYFLGNLNFYEVALAIVLSFIFAIFSYFLIERPAQRLQIRSRYAILLFYVLPLLIFYSLHSFVIKPRTENLHYNTQTPCFQTLEICNYGANKNDSKILVIGDSHTYSLAPFIDVIGKHYGFSAQVSGISGCAFEPTLPENTTNICQERNVLFTKQMGQFDTVIIANYFGNSDFRERLSKVMNFLKQFDIKIYVLNSSANFDLTILRREHLDNQMQKLFNIRPFKNDITKAISKDSLVNIKLAKDFIANIKNATWIDLLPIYPPKYTYNDRILLLDSNHLSPFGARVLANECIKTNACDIFKNLGKLGK